jgi:cellulose synthase/poly-beta-1,6-N-acetylglucosamine synthase-like glycosyltransferase
MTSLDPTERLHWSIHGLAEASPELSASSTTTAGQRVAMATALAAVLVPAVLRPEGTATAVLAATTLLYAAIVILRWRLFVAGSRPGTVITVTDDEARAVPDDDLPIYTILLPAFREPSIVEDLLAGIGRLDYPADKLDVRLLLEADDTETVDAATAADFPSFVTIELVPPAEPRTKPKACNWGLVASRGEFLTIYDAEDTPEPLQLRRAVVAFRRSGPDLACLQARLTYHNHRQNLLTRLFTAEYDTWFRSLLPGLNALGFPLPLGGTSNHIRTAVVLAVHGWDPYNVTEDADLGVRLNRLGNRSGVLDSETVEEANSDAINWVKQRSRWQKGYLQTGLVALRSPRRLVREIGLASTLGFVLLIPGSTLLALLNGVLFGVSAVWWLAAPTWLSDVYPEWLLHTSLLVTVIGNVVGIYAHMAVMARSPRPHLTWACLVLPLYWLLISLAATKAAWQLVTRPSYWEKTTHGLHVHASS